MGKNFFIALHVAFMALWVGCLFVIPALFAAHARDPDPAARARVDAMLHLVFFRIASPAAVLAVVFGTILIFYGITGGWLPVKLALVMGLVLLHLYCGNVFRHFVNEGEARSPLYYSAIAWAPLPLAAAIVALVVVKPF